jgi:hypothetical protein
MPEQTCALCGEALRAGEARLVPTVAYIAETGEPIAVERNWAAAIHARCKLADPAAAEAHLRALPEGGR